MYPPDTSGGYIGLCMATSNTLCVVIFLLTLYMEPIVVRFLKFAGNVHCYKNLQGNIFGLRYKKKDGHHR